MGVKGPAKPAEVPMPPGSGKSAYQTLPFAMDPLADWLRPERTQQPHRHLLLIRMAEGCDFSTLESFRHAANPECLFLFAGQPVSLGQWQQTLGLTPPSSPIWAKARYATALAAPRLFAWILAEPVVQSLFAEITLCQSLDAAPARGARRKAAPVPPAGPMPEALVGLIDHGFPVAGPLFNRQRGDGRNWESRLLALWVQDAKPNPDGGKGLMPPDDFTYGGVIRGEAIANLLAASGGDEDAVYSASGLFVASMRNTYWCQHWGSHGAHVSGLALPPFASSGRAEPVVAVHLPKRTVDDSSGAALTAHAFDGMRFILDHAEACCVPSPAQPPGVVINLSYGFNAGPHDGHGPLEKAMAELQALWLAAYPASPLVIVVPAGNAYQSQTFARFDKATLARPGGNSILWEVPPDDGSANSVQIWLPAAYAGKASITLTAPDGRAIRVANQPGALASLPGARGEPAAMAVFCPAQPSRPRALFQLVVGPTQIDAPRRAACGDWHIEISATGLGEGEAVEAWVQRDDLPTADTRPSRQSLFQHKGFQPYNPPWQPGDGTDETPSLVRPGTMNAMATGPATIVVGSTFRRQTFDIPVAIYSGGGRKEWPVNVDGLAVADDSPILWGCLSAGMRAATSVRLFGTSMAAAMATRAIAANMPAFRGQPIKAAFGTMLIDPPQPSPDPRAGGGRLPG